MVCITSTQHDDTHNDTPPLHIGTQHVTHMQLISHKAPQYIQLCNTTCNTLTPHNHIMNTTCNLHVIQHTPQHTTPYNITLTTLHPHAMQCPRAHHISSHSHAIQHPTPKCNTPHTHNICMLGQNWGWFNWALFVKVAPLYLAKDGSDQFSEVVWFGTLCWHQWHYICNSWDIIMVEDASQYQGPISERFKNL